MDDANGFLMFLFMTTSPRGELWRDQCHNHRTTFKVSSSSSSSSLPPQAEMSSEEASMTSQQRPVGSSAPTGRGRPVSTLRGTGSEPAVGRGSRGPVSMIHRSDWLAGVVSSRRQEVVEEIDDEEESRVTQHLIRILSLFLKVQVRNRRLQEAWKLSGAELRKSAINVSSCPLYTQQAGGTH